MATDTRGRAAEVAQQGTVLEGISWNTYLRLRDNPSNSHTRMSCLGGTLILMSPRFLHDRNGRKLAVVVSEVTEALRIPCLCTVTTTLRRKGARPRKGAGKEPDFGLDFRDNEPRMRTRDDLDLDPPPDLAIEVDRKADSSEALKLYARLGVPEVWRPKPTTRAL